VTGTARVVVTLTIFATMLALVVVRPRRWSEAWWTMLGAAAMLALGLVSPRQAISATLAGKNALLFLLSLLALSLLVGKSGFFDWAALRCAHIARGNARSLYRNAFVLGAIVTAILSLDTTAVILTPIMLALVKRLRLPATPYIVLCALVANVGSLLLPISNLTNILFADAFHQTFVAFAARMVAPQIIALATTYALLRWQFRRHIGEHFASESLPDPARVVPNRSYFMVCVAVLVVVLVGYFLAPLLGIEPYVIAFAGAAYSRSLVQPADACAFERWASSRGACSLSSSGFSLPYTGLRISASSACRLGGLFTCDRVRPRSFSLPPVRRRSPRIS